MRSDIVSEYLAQQAKIPFVWGMSDCVHLAAGMVDAFTGVNPADKYRYSTEAEALRIIANAGGLERLVSQEIGESLSMTLHGNQVDPGDIVLTAYPDYGQMLGVAQPARAWFRAGMLTGAAGLIPVQLDQCIKFWKVQCLKL